MLTYYFFLIGEVHMRGMYQYEYQPIWQTTETVME